LHALGKEQEASQLFRKAVAIFEQVLGETHLYTSVGYNGLGQCLQSMGRHSEALPLFRKALAIREQRAGQSDQRTATSCSNLAYCLEEMGKAPEALPLFSRALEVFEKTLPEAHPNVATSCNNLAYCLEEMGKTQDALPLHRKALALRQKFSGEMHPDTASSYNNVAACLDALGQPPEALPLYCKALAIKEQTLGVSHPETALSYIALGGCLHNLGKYAEAASTYRHAVTGREFGRFHAGNSGFDRSRFKSGFLPLRHGLAACLVHDGKPHDAWMHAEAYLGRGLLEDLDASKVDADRERLAQIEALNATIVPLLAREELPESDRKLRDSLVAQRARLDVELAHAMADRSEARLLPLARVQEQIASDAAIVLWIDYATVGEHLACVVRDRGDPVWVRLPGSGTDSKWTKDDWLLPERAQEALQSAAAPSERDRLLTALYTQRLAPLEDSLKGVRRLLVVPTDRMARVPVEALTDRYTVSYIPSASVYARRMEEHRALKGDSLLVLADPTYTAATPSEPPTDGVLLTIVLAGGNAARAGLRPGDVLRRVGKDTLASGADLAAALQQAPCEALVWRDGKEISVRLGEGKLSAVVDKRPAPAVVRDWRKQNERQFASGEKLVPLPGTRVEMQALQRLTSKHTALEGDDASEELLERLAETGALKGFRLIHLATHGKANEAFVQESALILAQHKTPDARENVDRVAAGKLPLSNRLTVATILRTWQLDADLVTLSACETGRGADAGGEGMLGFAQALLQKGARSVLLSRWQVNDAATALLMARFYETVLGKRADLKQPLGRAEALREAKQWLRTLRRTEAEQQFGRLTEGLARGVVKEGLPARAAGASQSQADRPFESPHYWAAFVLIGDPE
jgi:CHAT domain-containing protein/Tfp pilus assembly protein PilF